MLVFLVLVFYMFFFFFSSRRRHTRWPRDWSSDVCSSDLGGVLLGNAGHGGASTMKRANGTYPMGPLCAPVEEDRGRAVARWRTPRCALALAVGALALASATSAHAAPGAPSEVHAIATSASQVALSWSSPEEAQSVSGYEILRNGTRVGNTDGYTTRFLDTGLAPGSGQAYSVVALEGSERGAPSEPASVETASSVQTLEGCSSTPLAS